MIPIACEAEGQTTALIRLVLSDGSVDLVCIHPSIGPCIDQVFRAQRRVAG